MPVLEDLVVPYEIIIDDTITYIGTYCSMAYSDDVRNKPIGSFQKRSILPPQRKFLPSGGGEKIVSDNSKCIRTSEGGRGVNFLFPLWGWHGCFLE
jgi:hypothetical protein